MSKNYYFHLVILLCFLFSGFYASAQVKFKVELLSDNTTYQVSMLPESSYSGALSITNSAQVTLAFPTGAFEVDNFQAITGSWNSPTQYLNPIPSLNRDYLIVLMPNGLTGQNYVVGESIPLFTFENKGTCPGAVELMDTTDPFSNNSLNISAGNQITILGYTFETGQNNAYSGIIDAGSAVCETEQSTNCDIAITSVFSINETTCDANDGNIQIVTTGGTAPLEYSVDNGLTWGTSFSIGNLAPGAHYVKVRNATDTSCEVAYSLNPIVIDAYQHNILLVTELPSCATATDGSLSIGSDNNNAVLQYSIDNGLTYQSETVFSNLGNGVYTVKVKEPSTNCEFVSSNNPITFNITTVCEDETPPVTGECIMEYMLADSAGVFIVSMLSNISYTANLSLVASTQLTLRVPTGQLDIADINNYTNAEFALTGQQINPSTHPGYDFFSFSISNFGAMLPFTAGTSSKLFSFHNDLNCATGSIQLVGTGGLDIAEVNGASVATQLSVSGFGGADAPICVDDAISALIDRCNIDTDGDGVKDVNEDLNGDGNIDNDDTDGDGIANYKDNDDDNDNIATSIEEGAPNGGDGNGDGIPDCLQNTVASNVDLQGTYRTLETGVGHPISVYSIVTESAQSESDPGYDYPHFLDKFDIDATGTVDVRILYHDITDFSNLIYRKYGPMTPGGSEHVWYDFPHTFSTTNVDGQTVGVANIQLTDNQLGDSDATIGKIVDPGGLARATASTCDVEFFLTENNGVYEVSMLSNVSYTTFESLIASMQVTMRAPAGLIMVDENSISDTYNDVSFNLSPVLSPSETPNFDYFSFNAVVAPGSSDIPFVIGQTVPLFTFINKGTCSPTAADSLYLVGEGASFATPDLANNNIASQLSTAGGGIDQPVCVSDKGIKVVCEEDTNTPATATCEVQYILTETDGLYKISMYSDITWNQLESTISTMQITLRAPTGTLQVDDIIENYAGTNFSITSPVVNPSETPGYDYFSFTLSPFGTSVIPFNAGETVELFTFKNTGTCSSTDSLYLVGEGAPFPIPTITANNLESQLFTAGGGGSDTPVCVSSKGVGISCHSDGNNTIGNGCEIQYILEENNGVYEVKMYSDITWGVVDRIISSMQVTVRAPTGALVLNNECIEESYAGTVFELASSIIDPAETPGFDYFSFNLTSFGSNVIPFTAGETVSLFTFKTLGECTNVGDLYLVGDNGAFPVPSIPSHNLSSQLFAAGGGGFDTPVCVDENPVSMSCTPEEECRVTYILEDSADVHIVKMYSNVSWDAFERTISTMQVTMRAPTGVVAINNEDIVENFAGTTFEITSPVISPAETPAYDYFSFTISPLGTTAIPFVAGDTVNLFYFKNTGDCSDTDSLFLVGEGASFPMPVINNNNVASQLSTAGGGVDVPICVSRAGSSLVCTDSTPPPCVTFNTSATSTNPTNCTDSDGQIVINTSPSDGVIYSINGGGTWSTSNIFSGLSAGDYTIEVALSDMTCNMVWGQITLSEPLAPTISSVDTNQPATCGSTGSIQIFSAMADLLYSIDGGTTWSTTNLFTDLAAGNYTVQVALADRTCIVVWGQETITAPNPPAITSVDLTQPVTCEATGSIQILATSANGLIYSIDGGTTWRTNPLFTDVGLGNYTIAIANTDTTCVVMGNEETISGPSSPIILREIQANPSGCGTNNGLIQIATIPSTGLLYSINGGATWSTSNVFPSLSDGTYEIAVANANETCITAGSTIELSSPVSPTISTVTPTNPTNCENANGQIQITANPSTGLIYSIDGGTSWSTSNQFTGLDAGFYAIRVANADTSCVVTGTSLSLSSPAVSIITATIPTNPTNCENANGRIQISSNPSTGLIYSVDGGTSWSTSNQFTGLDAGSYAIRTANADTSCVVNGLTLTLNSPAAPTITSSISTQPTSCAGGNGSILVNASSGNLIYSIDGGSTWSSNSFFTALGVGNYTIAIANPDTTCVVMGNEETLVSPSSPTISREITINPSGCGLSNGSIQIAAIPSTGLLYSIDGGATWSTSNIFTGLSNGNYEISVANSDETCVTVGSTVELVSPAMPTINTITPTNITNCDDADGQIQITSNSVAGLIYSIDGGTTWSTSPQFTDLNAGFYSARIAYSDTSCVVNGASLDLSAPIAPTLIDATPTHPTDCAGTNGSILISAAPSNLIYSIDGGITWSTNPIFTNLSTDSYLIAIANVDTTCIVIGDVTLDAVASQSTITTTDPSGPTAVDGCLEINSSCTGVFEYSNDGGVTWQASNIFCGLGNGIYRPRIRCVDLSCFEELAPVELNSNSNSCAMITTPITNMTLCDASSISLVLGVDAPIASQTITGGVTTNVVRTNNDRTLTFDAQLNGLINFYTVTVVTTTGCELVEDFVLYQAQNTEADFVVVEPYCKEGEVTIQFTGNATPNAILDWTVDGGIIINSSPATSTDPAASEITVRWDTEGSKLIGLDVNDNGCTDDHVESIFVRKLPLVTVAADTVICIGDCIPLKGDGTAVWYNWAPAEGLSDAAIPNPTACPTTTTTYTLTAMGADGCITTKTVTVIVEEIMISVSANMSICIGEEVQLAASGGTTYNWSPTTGLNNPSIANPVASPTETTTYMVTVSNGIGCSEESSVTVTVNPRPELLISSNVEICQGESAQLTVNTHSQYAWSPAEGLSSTTIANPIASPSSTTTYTVVVTDELGCTNTAQVEVAVKTIDINLTVLHDTICNGYFTQLEATGGVSYAWEPALGLNDVSIANPTAKPLVSTDYCVTVTDAGGCTSTDCIRVEVDNETCSPCSISASANGPVCGTVGTQLNATGSFSYVWSPSIGLSNPNIANPIATPTENTIYTVTGTSADGFCIATAQVTVTVEPLPNIITYREKFICAGDSIHLLVNGHAGYAWSPTNTMINSDTEAPLVFPLSTTIYTVTVTSENGCTNTETITVNVSDGSDGSANAGSDESLCNGSAVQLNASGGTTYTWFPTAGLSNPNIANPIASPTVTTEYCVTVGSNGSCSSMDCMTITVDNDCTPPPACQVSGGANMTICSGSSIQMNATGANTYVWSPAAGLSNPNVANPIASPSTSTLYTVTGTSIDGCVSSAVVNVFVGSGTSPVAVACEDKTICLGESIRLVVTTHSTYVWEQISPSFSTGVIQDANTGAPTVRPTATTTYRVTVTNEQGCMATDEVIITVGGFDCTPGISCQVSGGANMTICSGASVQMNATGANTYVWSPAAGLSNPNIANPIASPSVSTLYTVTGTTIDGCVSSAVVNVAVGSGTSPLAVACEDKTICIGESIRLVVNTNASYIWEQISPSFSTGAIQDANTGAPTVRPTATTTYRVTVTNEAGCTATDEVIVTVGGVDCTPAVSCQVSGGANSTICAGASVQMNATGANTYVWSPSVGLSNPNIANPIASPSASTLYTVRGTSIDGCVSSAVVNVFVGGNSPVAVACEDKTICIGESIRLVVTTHSTYAWEQISPSFSTGVIQDANTGAPTVSPTATTTYRVTVTNEAGCTATDDVIINVGGVDCTPAVSCQVSGGANMTICAGSSVQMNATGANTYVWSPSIGLSNPNIANPIASPSVSTLYTVRGTSINGCVSSAVVNVFVDGLSPVVVACEDKTICEGESVRMVVTTHTSYAWAQTSPSFSTGFINDANTGTPTVSPSQTTTYVVTVTNEAGCTATDDVIINVNNCDTPPASCQVNGGPNETICDDESVQLNAVGASTYSWSPTVGLSNPNIANPVASPASTTTYTVTGRSATGCVSSAALTVTVENCNTPPACQVNGGPNETICDDESVQLNAVGASSYSWSPTAGLSNPNIANPVASPRLTTTYVVTGRSATGCVSSAALTVTVENCNTPPACQVNGGPNETICDDESVQLNAVGASTYSWSPTAGLSNPNIANPVASPTSTTTYVVKGRSATGCVSSAALTITVENCNTPPACQVNGGPNETICDDESVQLNAVGASTYSWSPTAGLSNPDIANPVASPTSTTTYTVTGRSATGCVSSAALTVTVENCNTPPACLVNVDADQTICQGTSAQLNASGALTYNWSPTIGLSNPDISNPVASPASTTTYTVTGRSLNGCVSSAVVTINIVNGNPIANAGNDAAICPDGSIPLFATGGVRYEWSPSESLDNPNIQNPTASPNSVTTYTVTVTDESGCTDTDEVRIMVSLPIMTDESITNASCCGFGGGSIFVNASGGFGNLTYNWSNVGLSGNTVSDLDVGDYTVTITDAQGCSVVETITVGSNCETCVPAFMEEMTCVDQGTEMLELCVPIIGSANDYIITIDGVVTNTNNGCNFENVISYSYVSIPSLNINSSFKVEEWEFNGAIYSTDVMTIADLTNWMNGIDPEGQWILNSTAFTLTGGLSTNNYGVLKLVNQADRQESLLQPNFIGRAMGVLISVDMRDGKDHIVRVEHPSTCCVDELIVSLCTGGQPCLDDMIAADELELTINDCDATATFCIEIPASEIENYTITDNGLPYENDLVACAFGENGDGTLLNVSEGYHELIFENGANGCQDRLLVDVKCPANVVLDTMIILGEEGVLCLENLVPASSILSATQTCLLEGSEVIAVEQLSDFCWKYTGLTVGMERFCIDLCTDDGICKTIIQVVNVLEPEAPSCPDFLGAASLSGSLIDCTDKAEFCIDLPFDSIRQYGMLLDGAPFREAMAPCAEGTLIRIEMGRHNLHLTHLATGCMDSISIKVDCPTDIVEISETVEINEIGIFCPEPEHLLGPITSIENICPEESGELAIFELIAEQNCIGFTGVEMGAETACLVVCDDNLICDTIILTVHVVDAEPRFPIAMFDTDSTEENTPITLEVIDNDSINGSLRIIEMVSYPLRGEASMNIDNTITYMPEENYCELDNPEQFLYRLCNQDGCDTAYIQIRIPCPDFDIKTGFSPNGDGINDVFYIQGLKRFPNNELQVFNRWGTLVFKQQGYDNQWAGTFEEAILPDATYFYILDLGDGSKPKKGYVQINK